MTWELLGNLLIAIGQVDARLGDLLKKLVSKSVKADQDVDIDLHDEYKEELFSLLVGMTEGEAKANGWSPHELLA